MASYTVVSGDTLSSLSSRFSTSIESLAQANMIYANNLLRPGTTLILVESNDLFRAILPNGFYPASGANTFVYWQKEGSSKTVDFSSMAPGSNTVCVYLYDGNDTYHGSMGKDEVSGGVGNDTIFGYGSDDTLLGEAGNDRLVGGAGADQLTGGAGADTFVFNDIAHSTVASSGRDTITDFSRSQGDKIDLSGIDASTAASGNQAFSFVGTTAFKKVAGELRYQQSSGDTLVQGDVNGDGKADFSILVEGVVAFTNTDFIL